VAEVWSWLLTSI